MRYAQYKMKFYLNIRHSVINYGVPGDVHPHTWEVVLHVAKSKDQKADLADFEERIDDYFTPFQENVINDLPPFDIINPTLENCAEYFRERLQEILNQNDWILLMMEMSESPSLTYVISMIDEQNIGANQMLSALTDDLLEGIREAKIDE